jgi:hypothetical protein
MGVFLDLTGIGWGSRARGDWTNLLKNWFNFIDGNVLSKMETLGLVRESEVTVA